MLRMAGRWSKNPSLDFNIDQRSALLLERFCPRLMHCLGAQIISAKLLHPPAGSEPDSSFFLGLSAIPPVLADDDWLEDVMRGRDQTCKGSKASKKCHASGKPPRALAIVAPNSSSCPGPQACT
jgi:hypothetical protein